MHGFWDPETQDLRVHDWRAPVSSLYYDYDYETGAASFHAPEGVAEGEITGKRQYKIEGGQLQYLLESSINIGDEVLQRELSQSADEKMRNIVATIQREQNAVIRNETADVLILQGVAGSGKTSIALHRLAFLLYRFKDTLSSDNVMSPNKVFADYSPTCSPSSGRNRLRRSTSTASPSGTSRRSPATRPSASRSSGCSRTSTTTPPTGCATRPRLSS